MKILQLVLFTALILYFGSVLFIPMCYGLLIAIVLYPVCKWLEHHGWSRTLSITAGLLIIFIIFIGLLALLFAQLNTFGKDLPELMKKLDPSLSEVQHWIESDLGLSIHSQNEWKQKLITNFSDNAGNIAKSTISSATSTLFTLFLVPVYSALFLYNRGAFVKFVAEVTGKSYDQQVQSMLREVIHTYYSFIRGMILVYLIVGVLNSMGLLALGIRHAILFGMLTAIMTIIPYVGIFISALLPISVAWITKDSIWYPLGVIGVFALVQYLEANIIFPKIVATQLKVSTWATLVAIIAGGILWGVSGMILFIPFIGILKIILDYIPGGKVFNILLAREKS